jgi:hypothetical protein
MSNPYRTVLREFPDLRSNDSHWVALLLSVLADRQDANPVESTFNNPWREVLHRLRNYPGFALQRLTELFGSRVN